MRIPKLPTTTSVLAVGWLLAGAIAGPASAATGGAGFRPIPVVGGAPAAGRPQTPAAPGQVVGAVGQIAFVSDNLGNPNVVKVNSDGTGRGALTDCPVTTCPLGSGAPAYSPDGTQVVFVKGWDANGQGPIDTMTSGGKSEAQLGTL